MHILFKIIYSIFYAFSLLPFRVLYFFSDLAAFLLRDVFRYRRQVIDGNLRIAFPQKSQAERDRIAHDFYGRFCDNFLETLKLLSISKEELQKRFTVDLNILDELHSHTSRSVVLALGHFFNWEMANLAVGLSNPFRQVLVYKKVQNSFFEQMMVKIRERFNTVLMASEEFRQRFRRNTPERYCLILVADQNPYQNKEKAYWSPFFGVPVPFVKGPERTAAINRSAVVFGKIKRLKRGYYTNELALITAEAEHTRRGEITLQMIRLIEENIQEDPANYLWSHRRFKHQYQEQFAPNFIQ